MSMAIAGDNGRPKRIKLGMQKSNISRAFQTFQGQRGRGPEALFVAVMGAAAVDLANGDQGAAQYFLSDTYRHHLELVGLPAEYLPDGVTRADLLALVEGPALSRPRICHNMSQLVTG